MINTFRVFLEKGESFMTINPFGTCFEVYVVVMGKANSVDAWELALEEVVNQYPEYNPINAELIKTPVYVITV